MFLRIRRPLACRTVSWNILPNWFYHVKDTKSERFAPGAVFFEMSAIATTNKRMNDFQRTRGKLYGGWGHAEAPAALQDLKGKSGNKDQTGRKLLKRKVKFPLLYPDCRTLSPPHYQSPL